MPTLLDSIITGKRSLPRRILLYGIHGIGKSTWGASAPAPLFLQTEEGADEIGVARTPILESYDQVIDAITALYQDDHPFKSIVVDTVDELERLIWTEVCKTRAVKSIDDIGYAKGYAYALTHWRSILDGLGALRRDRGMHVILIAHSRIDRFEDPSSAGYDRYVPQLHKLASSMVQEWVDEVLFARYQVHVKTEGQGFRERGKGIGTGERVVHTTERPAHLAKNRLNLPDQLPLDWTAYAEYLPKNGKKGK